MLPKLLTNMNIAKNTHQERKRPTAAKYKRILLLTKKCKLNPSQRKKRQKLSWKELTNILLVLVFFSFPLLDDLDDVGVPISDTRTEPSASAIDLAVKTLKEKERQQKYY